MNEIYMMLFCYGILYGIGFFIGKFAKNNIVFGVTIKDKFLEEDQIITYKRAYIRIYGVVLGIITAIFIYRDYVDFWIYNFLIYTFIWLFVMVTIYGNLNNKMKKLKKELYKNETKSKSVVVSASLKNRAVEMPQIGLHFLAPGLLGVIPLLMTIMYYPNIPTKIPMHYDAAGTVTRYSDKGFWTVYLLVIIELSMTLFMFAVTYYSIKYSKRELNPKQPNVSERQQQIAIKRFSLIMALITFIMNITFIGLHFLGIGIIPYSKDFIGAVTWIPMVALFIPLIWFFVTTGMNGEKLKVDIDEELRDVDVSDDDEYWVWGMFYNNKNDSSIFVPKRFGGGFTINMGNRAGLILMIVIILLVIGSVALPFLVA